MYGYWALAKGCAAIPTPIQTPFDGPANRNLSCTEYVGCRVGRILRCLYDGEHGDEIPDMEAMTWWFFAQSLPSKPPEGDGSLILSDSTIAGMTCAAVIAAGVGLGAVLWIRATRHKLLARRTARACEFTVLMDNGTGSARNIEHAASGPTLPWS